MMRVAINAIRGPGRSASPFTAFQARRVRRPAAQQGGKVAARGGFSLLEVVLVLAIIAIAAVIAVPRYARALVRYRAETAARRLAADLEYARTLAHHASGNQAVVFDTAADGYTLTGRTDPDRAGQPYTVALAGDPYRADLVAADFGGTASVTFDAYGTPDSGGTVRLEVGDYAFTVTVDGQSGDITLTGPSAK